MEKFFVVAFAQQGFDEVRTAKSFKKAVKAKMALKKKYADDEVILCPTSA